MEYTQTALRRFLRHATGFGVVAGASAIACSAGAFAASANNLPSAATPAGDWQHFVFGELLATHAVMVLGIASGVLLVALLAFGAVSRAARRAVAQKARELRASEARLAAAQQIGQIGHWVLDIATGGFTCSDELYRIYGIEIGTPLSLDLITAPVHEDDRPRARQIRDAAIAEKRGYAFDFRIRRPSGEIRHVEGKTDVILDGHGAVTGFFGITQDVSDRHQAIEALRLTQFALDNAADAAMWLGEDGRIEYVNRAGQRMLGYSLDEMLKMHIWDIDPEVLVVEWPSVWNRIIARGHHSFEAVHMAHDGAPVPVEVSTSPIRFSGRQILCSFSRDITQRKAAEAALRAREAQLRLVVDSLPVLINYLDADRRYVLVNKTAADWYGQRAEDVIGKRPEDIFGQREESWRFKQADALRGEVTTDECTIAYPDGKTRIVRALFVPDIGEDGRVHGLFSLTEDITQFKQVEEQLRRSQKMEAIGQVTGGVAHEFNNLLMAITGNLELLLEGGFGDTEDVRRQLETVVKSAFRGKDLTSRLLSYSGNPFDRPEVMDVAEAIDGVIRFLGPVLGETIAIETELAAGLWPVKVDPSEFENALTNLAINARDAMPEGGTITITCANATLDDAFAAGRPYAVRTGDYVRVSVRDTGTGMPPEVAERVFDPFFTTKEVGQGTGLGMSMVFGFVHRQSNGYVDIETEEGRGTTVTLYFPRIETAAGEACQGSNVVSLATRRRTVLLVEDEEELCNLLTGMLRTSNYVVTSAATAAAALALLDPPRQIDLLVTDVVLPSGMNGVELAERVRVTQPGVKIVLISGYAESELAARGIPEGRYPLLGKPFRKTDLLAALDGALGEEGQEMAPAGT